MKKGKIRNIFPGSNTSKGFYEFYDSFVKDDSNRVFYLKGGPGIGKSVFVRHIGNEIINRGIDVEYLYCSSDSDSLDGIHIPSMDLTIVDATPPHLMDPKNPGAVDEIIYLGECWNEEGLRENREDIIEINREVKRLYRKTFFYLKMTKLLKEELGTYIKDAFALDFMELNKETRKLRKELFDSSAKGKADKRQYIRHYYAVAITPQGVSSFLENLFDPLDRRIVLKGRPGTGKSTIVKKLLDEGISRGLSVDICHCALDPDKYEHLIFPELNMGIVTGVPPHEYEPKAGDIIIDTERYIDVVKLARFRWEMELVETEQGIMFKHALDYLERVKQVRDRLEEYYSSNSDFTIADRKREEVLDRILSLL